VLTGLLTKAVPSRGQTGHKLSSEKRATGNYPSGHVASWFTRLGSRRDIRLLLLGSLLPDIVDKPVGQVWFRETLANGRIFCHTMLFLVIMALAGLLRYRRNGGTGLLVVSFGVLTHLVLDQMWLWPPTLLWPLYGFAFPKVYIPGWLDRMWDALLSNPAIYVPEIIGGAVLVLFLWVLVRSGKLVRFIKSGRTTDA